jgi:hypothetical protein
MMAPLYSLRIATLILQAILSAFFLWHLSALRTIDPHNSQTAAQIHLWAFLLTVIGVQMGMSFSLRPSCGKGRAHLLYLLGEIVKFMLIAIFLLLWIIAVEDARKQYLKRFTNLPKAPMTDDQLEKALETPYPSAWSFYWMLFLWYAEAHPKHEQCSADPNSSVLPVNPFYGRR